MLYTILLLCSVLSVESHWMFDEPPNCRDINRNEMCQVHIEICKHECSYKFRYELDSCKEETNCIEQEYQKTKVVDECDEKLFHICLNEYFIKYLFPCEERCDTDNYYTKNMARQHIRRICN